MDDLYDFAAQEIFQSRVLRLSAPRLTPFNHPPFTTIFYAPFALGGYEVGLFLWLATGVLALALTWSLLRRELIPLASYSTFRLTLLSFCFYPAIAWLLANQNSAFTLLVYTIMFIQLRRQHDLAAGASLGLLLYKPQLALTPAFILLINRRVKAMTGFVLTSALLVALGFLASPRATVEYVRLLPRIAELPFFPGYPIEKMHNIYGLCLLSLSDFLPVMLVEATAILLSAGSLLVIALWWSNVAWRTGTPEWDLTMAATLTLGLLISPHLMIYELMIWLLPLSIVYAVCRDKHRDRLLDGGPVLVLTVLGFAAAFLSAYLTPAMLEWSAALTGSKVAVQLTIPVIFAWAVAARRAAVNGAGQSTAFQPI